MPNLDSTWQSGADFLDRYEAREEGPGHFFQPAEPGDIPAEAGLGKLVSVRLRLVAEQREFHFHAHVIERHINQEPRGLMLEFLPAERDREQLVLATARGESVPYFRRRHERIPCKLPAQLKLASGQTVEATVHEMSASGLGFGAEADFKVGDLIQLSITMPNQTQQLVVYGRVMSLIAGGPQRGAGIEFQFESASQRASVEQQVASLRGAQ